MSQLPAANLLANETSPYLLQHKDNPVHWRAWGPAALAEAEATGKPIFLSSGYSACHWCHVMEKESFLDRDTATVLNENFVNIKLDREERPDVDAVYQASVQALGQQGGWPLSVFLTPKGEPFAGGTYFPKEDQPAMNRPGFTRVLNDVLAIFRERKEQVAANVDGLRQALNTAWSQDRAIEGQLTPVALEQAARRMCQSQDVFSGGINGAPKFPNVSILEALWRGFLRTGAPQFQQAVETQLRNMCLGGIYDHLGGGFARYAVDEFWLIPHFEKMLYDNALLVEILASVWQETRSPLYKSRIEETIGWMQREMLTQEGAFAAALDADTEGEEGRYYVWTAAEIDQILNAEDSKLFKQVFDVRDGGNWEGRSILHRLRNIPLDPMTEGRINGMRQKLLDARAKRTRPFLDDKILADWNGLAIRALTVASEVMNRLDWQAMAVRAFWFVADKMGDGAKLAHAYRMGKTSAPGLSEDYAYMIRAALTLFEATGDQRYLQKAQDWTGEMDRDFWTPLSGGYAQSPASGDPLFVRPRQGMDTATPNASAVMGANLAQLYFFTGEQHYRDRSNATLAAFARDALGNIGGHAAMYNALDTIIRVLQIVIVGERQSPDVAAMRDVLRRISLPNRVLHIVPAGQNLPASHPAFGKTQVNARATAYLCNASQCSAPIGDANQLELALKTRNISPPPAR
jgi:hypothetical protein